MNEKPKLGSRRRWLNFLLAMDRWSMTAVREAGADNFTVPNCAVCLTTETVDRLLDSGLLKTVTIASGGFKEVALSEVLLVPAEIDGAGDG